jgi:hypothetical protein
VSATFPAKDFYITIGDKNSTIRSAFVTAATPTTLTIASSVTWNTGEHIEIASALGAPLAVDYNKDGTATPGSESVNLEISASTTPGSSWINGSAIISGNTIFDSLRDPQATPSATSGQVRASGLLQVIDAGAAKVSGTYKDGTTVSAQNLVSSTDSNFPFVNDVRALGIVSDGANRIGNSPLPTRQVEPFTPPDITQGGNGFGRYRQLTKYSADATYDALNDGVADTPQSGAYGYSQGIYINNPQDKEKVYDTTLNSFREMTETEVKNLLFSNVSDTAQPFLRLSSPALRTDGAKSLEEQHLRGWINPSEFRARGAEIVLDPDNARVIITLEATTDGRSTLPTPDAVTLYSNEGPVPSQGWRKPDGDLIGDATYGGTYQQTFRWPANGVIFAEGNVRIRGEASTASIDPGRSLTVVSMNNIYIEGSLSAGARKVALLAKKNVIMNPTRVVKSVEAQTRLAAATTTGATVLQVSGAENFRVGDYIEIKTTSNAPQRRITAISLSADENVPDQITVDTPLSSTTYPVGKVVEAVHDPWFNNNQPFNQHAIRVEKFSDIVQRRLHLAPGSNNIRLAFRHNGERKDALTIRADAPTTAPNSPILNSAEMDNKMAGMTLKTIIEGNEKGLNVIYDQTPGGGPYTETFPDGSPTPPPATQADAIAKRLEDLASDMVTRHPNSQWHYSASVNSSYNAGTKRPLFYFLASVGNRLDWLNPLSLPTSPISRKDINATDYVIPMGTSVWALMNGVPAELRKYDSVLSSDVSVKQFGFNPNYDGTATPDAREDILTSDQGFYQNGTGSTTSGSYNIMQTADKSNYTLDPRELVFTGQSDGINTLALRLNNSIVDTATSKTVSDYFNATTPANSDIPFYRMSRIKVEEIVPSNDANQVMALSPGHTFNVQAYVYAQEGSWYVIPGADFDSRVKSNYVDLNDNNVMDAGENLDLNRDGQITRDETIAAYRYSRYNYQINFKGAIMEKQTAFVSDPDGVGKLTAEVGDWTDKWATINVDFSSGSQVDTTGTIVYQFDADAANNPSSIFDADTGWRPPISPDLIYQSG